MRKIILLILCISLSFAQSFAQSRVVTGKVTDEKGAPIEGVSILSPDGKQGTQTDGEGLYSISLPNSVKTLIFSNVNFVCIVKPIMVASAQ